jgi:uncharacterized protein (UPF0548 family)
LRQDEAMVALLSESVASDLRSAPFTYREVGATAGVLPPGYAHLERTRALPSADFGAGAERLMRWHVHAAAGLRVAASAPQVEPGTVVEMFLGPRWLRVRAVCRVVYVIDEPDRAGFAYGMLPGHPVSGEEAFILERVDGDARFSIRAFSRPATRLARIGGPAASLAQRMMASRYLEAVLPGR